MRELTYGVCIKCIDTCKGFLSDCLLIISEEKTTEFFSLEKVFAMVFGLGHGKHILMGVALVNATRVEFESQSGLGWRDHCIQMLQLSLLLVTLL